MHKVTLFVSIIAILVIPAVATAQITVNEQPKDVWSTSSQFCDFKEVIRGLDLKIRRTVYSVSLDTQIIYELVNSRTGQFFEFDITFNNCQIVYARRNEVRSWDNTNIDYELEMDMLYVFMESPEYKVELDLMVTVRLHTYYMPQELKERLFRTRTKISGKGTMFFISSTLDGFTFPESPDKIKRLTITIIPNVIRIDGDTWDLSLEGRR